MFHCGKKCNLTFSPVETYLNPQRSSRRPPSYIFIRNILFILPLGGEWKEWRSVHSGMDLLETTRSLIEPGIWREKIFILAVSQTPR